jgi:hypothetical protein
MVIAIATPRMAPTTHLPINAVRRRDLERAAGDGERNVTARARLDVEQGSFSVCAGFSFAFPSRDALALHFLPPPLLEAHDVG